MSFLFYAICYGYETLYRLHFIIWNSQCVKKILTSMLKGDASSKSRSS